MLLLTLLITFLLTTFAFLRSHYLSTSPSFRMSAEDMDQNLSLYGLHFGKIVHRFGNHRCTANFDDNDVVLLMYIGFFSETNTKDQSFNSRYSLHTVQRIQHSRYDNPAKLALAATALKAEIARHHQPLPCAARDDLFPRVSDEEELGEKTISKKRKRRKS